MAFPVSIQKENELKRRMAALHVHEDEIEESFVRSSGAGGQKVNKSSSCVMLWHSPTNIRVKCQISRSQAMNRFLARRILLDKIERQQKGFVEAERAQIEKIRRQKKRRTRRGKERMLQEKHRQSEKKQDRGKRGWE